MPDQHPTRTHRVWLLSMAAGRGQLVWIECGYCRKRRHYLPGDLQKLLGNVDVHTLPRRIRCELCGRRDRMEADVYLPVAAERAGMTIRRLVEIRVRQIPVWRDEGP